MAQLWLAHRDLRVTARSRKLLSMLVSTLHKPCATLSSGKFLLPTGHPESMRLTGCDSNVGQVSRHFVTGSLGIHLQVDWLSGLERNFHSILFNRPKLLHQLQLGLQIGGGVHCERLSCFLFALGWHQNGLAFDNFLIFDALIRCRSLCKKIVPYRHQTRRDRRSPQNTLLCWELADQQSRPDPNYRASNGNCLVRSH
ncbi:hypothetical protein DO62_5661 [Burkholderia pseudomallei]|nr:hypothetical protein DO62_5661 [Burkholderia pseudomallei]